MQVLTGGRILMGGELCEGLDLVISDGRIADIRTAGSVDGPMFDLDGDMLLPGFVDVQVNGGGGALFNADPSVDCIRRIGEAHRQFGTTGFMPTLISDDLGVVDAGMRSVEEAIEAGVPGVLGIHIEGPFLNPARKGIHDESKFRRLDAAAVELLTSLKHGVTMVTIAPELAEMAEVRALADAGVKVCLGHTDAPEAVALAALEAGASGFTHLYNAMSQLTGRASGVVGTALASEGTFAGLIVDKFHVGKTSCIAAIRAKGADEIMLVSDAMPAVGEGDGTFELMGVTIQVEDGKATGPDGTLAGSALDMAGAVRNARDWLGCSLADSVMMASATPAAFLGLSGQTGDIKSGLAADLVQVDDQLNVKSSWIDGNIIRHTA